MCWTPSGIFSCALLQLFLACFSDRRSRISRLCSGPVQSIGCLLSARNAGSYHACGCAGPLSTMSSRDYEQAKSSVKDAANKVGGAAQSQYEQTVGAAKDATGTAQDKTHSFLSTAQVRLVDGCMKP